MKKKALEDVAKESYQRRRHWRMGVMRSMMRNPSRRSFHWGIRSQSPIATTSMGTPRWMVGKDQVISEMAGSTLYGRQGDALGQGEMSICFWRRIGIRVSKHWFWDGRSSGE